MRGKFQDSSIVPCISYNSGNIHKVMNVCSWTRQFLLPRQNVWNLALTDSTPQAHTSTFHLMISGVMHPCILNKNVLHAVIYCRTVGSTSSIVVSIPQGYYHKSNVFFIWITSPFFRIKYVFKQRYLCSSWLTLWRNALKHLLKD